VFAYEAGFVIAGDPGTRPDPPDIRDW
jgi:hypothetical protein